MNSKSTIPLPIAIPILAVGICCILAVGWYLGAGTGNRERSATSDSPTTSGTVESLSPDARPSATTRLREKDALPPGEFRRKAEEFVSRFRNGGLPPEAIGGCLDLWRKGKQVLSTSPGMTEEEKLATMVQVARLKALIDDAMKQKGNADPRTQIHCSDVKTRLMQGPDSSGDVWYSVIVTVKNDSTEEIVSLTLKAVDKDGFELTTEHVRGSVPKGHTLTLTDSSFMNREHFNSIARWEIQDVYTRPRDRRISVSGVRTKLMEGPDSQGDVWYSVIVTVKNDSDEETVLIGLQAVDKDGFLLSKATVRGRVPRGGARTLTDKSFMSLQDYRRIEEWVVQY